MAACTPRRLVHADLPAVNDHVVVRVDEVGDMGAYVTLLEYENAQGIVVLSEVSRMRVRLVRKFMRVGRVEVCVVLRCDADKRYLDLSKRRVKSEDAQRALALWKQRHGAWCVLHRALEDKSATDCVYRCFAELEAADPAVDMRMLMLAAARDPTVGFSMIEDEPTRVAVAKEVQHRWAPSSTTVEAHIMLGCNGPEGIEAIKRALIHAREVMRELAPASTEELRVESFSKMYVLALRSHDEPAAVEAVHAGVEEARRTIKSADGGLFQVVREPKPATEYDHSMLERLRAELTAEDGNEPLYEEEDEEDEQPTIVDFVHEDGTVT